MIGGTTGESSSALVLPAVFGNIVATELHSNITWTGKTNVKSTKKFPFKTCKRTIKLIIDLCTAAAKNYSRATCEHDIIYKMMKYGYRKKNNDSDSSSTRSTSPESIQVVEVLTSTQQQDPTTSFTDLNTLPIIFSEEISNEKVSVYPPSNNLHSMAPPQHHNGPHPSHFNSSSMQSNFNGPPASHFNGHHFIGAPQSSSKLYSGVVPSHQQQQNH